MFASSENSILFASKCWYNHKIASKGSNHILRWNDVAKLFSSCLINHANIDLFKFNNRNVRKRSEICSKLTIKTSEQRQWHLSGIFIVNLEHISHLFLVNSEQVYVIILWRYICQGKSNFYSHILIIHDITTNLRKFFTKKLAKGFATKYYPMTSIPIWIVCWIFRENMKTDVHRKRQPSRGVLSKKCSENMQKMYRRAPMLCKFIEITLQHGCSTVNLLHIFRTLFIRTPMEVFKVFQRFSKFSK